MTRPECGSSSRRLHDTCGLSVAKSPLDGPAAVTTGGTKTSCLSSKRWASRRSTSKGCALGLKGDAGMPMAKLWAVASDCRDLHDDIERHQCAGRHEHTECHGHWAKFSEGYTDNMAIAIHNAWLNYVSVLSPSPMVAAPAQAAITPRRVPPLVTSGRMTHPFQTPSVVPLRQIRFTSVLRPS